MVCAADHRPLSIRVASAFLFPLPLVEVLTGTLAAAIVHAADGDHNAGPKIAELLQRSKALNFDTSAVIADAVARAAGALTRGMQTAAVASCWHALTRDLRRIVEDCVRPQSNNPPAKGAA